MSRMPRIRKPAHPAWEALADTWVFPALTLMLTGIHFIPDGGDWLLRSLTCLAAVLSLVAFVAAWRQYRRLARFQQYRNRHIARWQAAQARQHAAWLRVRGQDGFSPG